MANPGALSLEQAAYGRVPGGNLIERSTGTMSAVSWGAIAAGAAAAAALSLILLILGLGLGLSSVSPWSHAGVGAATLGISTIVWLTVTQLLASGMGGYLAGRLRTKWTEVHPDEVFFRDTAHGFLAWAVASLATAAMLSSVIGSIVGGGIQAGSTVAAGAATTATAGMAKDDESGSMAYFVDSLFRRDAAQAGMPATTNGPFVGSADQERSSVREAAEIGRIFTNLSLTEPLPVDDVRHVGQLIAQRTGLSQADAEKRVTDTYARAQAQFLEAETATREAADAARKASAYTALWIFISLLIGAFVASLAATVGGRQRDT
ncbi:hypothetical protein [Hydrogenophaga sp.]|uniref:hypothetical protein n=1 Tax=Hydrogenophaga sp. TaxID=1904254 RepID=UPI0027253514|nr:hypothetical protein [Hydrogenophaga sp.]MDO8906761.1 hypothetical protein [Hydrogenophaga sp.]